MTSGSTSGFEELVEAVDRLAGGALFEPIEVDEELVDRAWRSPCAVLVLCRLETSEPRRLQATKARVCDWLEARLLDEQSRGFLVDGYLLLALSAEPGDESLRRQITQIEQDPSVCRKHVLWPLDGSWEYRLERVTTLALPAAPDPAEPADIPRLPPKAARAFEWYRQLGQYKKVLARIMSEVGLGGDAD